MKHLGCVLILLALLPVLGITAYSPYWQSALTSSPGLTENGQVSYQATGAMTVSGGTFSLIGSMPPDGSTEYEVKSIALTGGSMGTLHHYLNAPLNAVASDYNVQSYYLVEFFSGSGLVRLRRVSVHLGVIAQGYVYFREGALLRSVLGDNGRILVYVDDTLVIDIVDTVLPRGGRPGVGVSGWGAGVGPASFGPLDRTPPPGMSTDAVRSWVNGNEVSLAWEGAADDANGVGVSKYRISRNGVFLVDTDTEEFTDTTVSPGTTYTYSVQAADFHASGYSPALSFAVVTPPATHMEARQVGVRPLSIYWGASGEQVDLRSGNLNFTVPLLAAQGRNQWKVPISLNYNLQQWRADSGGTWKLSSHTGHGFGWRLLAGSITPFWQDYWTIHHYLYTDSSGAEYRLDVKSGGMWKSREGVYAAYDPATARLYFRDGSFWVMGAVSGGIDKDAGTRYPTEMRDAFGNTILLRYDMGDGAAYADSSGRISEVEDARAVASGSRYVTYSFQYNNGSTRTLASISNLIGTAESYTFNVAEGQNLYSPFAPNSPSGTTALLLSITNGAGQTQSFSYSAAGELTRVDFPGGGYMRWDYRDFTFSGGRIYREVQTRYLATRTNAPEWPYGIGRDPRVYPNVAVLSRRDFAWATSASGNPFLTRVTTRLNPGTADEATSAQDQTVDANGNVTTQRIYDYGQLTTPSRTWTAAYVTNPAYTSKQKFSLLASATVTDGAQTITAVQNTCDGTAAQAGGWTRNFVPAAAPVGFLTRQVAPGTVRNFVNYVTGAVARVDDGYGHLLAITPDAGKNGAAPASITPNSTATLATSFQYAQFLGLTVETEPNNAASSIVYDNVARPAETTSKFGAVTTYEYSVSPPWVKATTNGRWVKTWTDAFGRTVKVEKGDAGGTRSVQDTEYGPCGCSPIGKMSRISNPYAPGQTPVWTSYLYDANGRMTQKTLPDGSRTIYSYAGNQVTVTDAAGKWKKYRSRCNGESGAGDRTQPGRRDFRHELPVQSAQQARAGYHDAPRRHTDADLEL